MKTTEKFKEIKKDSLKNEDLINKLKDFKNVDILIEDLIKKNVIKRKGYDIISIDKITSQKLYFNNTI